MSSGRRAKLGFALVWGLLGGGALFAQNFRQGGEFQVNRYTFNNQYDASVARDADGDFVVVWTDAAFDGGKGIFGLLFNSAGVFLGNQFRVNTYTPSSQHRAVVASEANGDFVVVWQSFNQGGTLSHYTIFGQRFTSAGAPLGVEFQVNQFTTIYSYLAKIASDADGDFVVVWESHNTESADGSSSGVFARRFNSSGSALGGEFQVNTYTQTFQGRPAIASDADGDFVIVWHSSTGDGQGDGIFGKRFNSGGTAQALEFRVNTYTLEAQQIPAIAAEADGDFVVVWQSLHQDGVFPTGNLGIFGRRFNSSGVGQAIEFMVNLYTIGYQRKPQIASDDNGDYVVTWESQNQDGGTEGVFARRVSPGGAAFGPEFQVNSYTPDGQKQIFQSASTGQGVDFDADGDFVIVWFDENITPSRDGNASGVFAQRFSLPPLATLDVDGNGILDPLTDGLLILRDHFNFTGTSLTTAAIGPNCSRCDGTSITNYLTGLGLVLDIDNNGALDPLTDGLLTLRFLFGFTGTTLTNGAVAGNCVTRCNAATILPYLQTLD